jgi:hypothetical protein
MRIAGAGIAVLALCLGGCGARTGNEAGNAGGANLTTNAAAPADNGLAAGNMAAPAGPCPFPNRGWRTAVVREGTPPELRIALTGETRPDSGGFAPTLASTDTPPPTIFLDIETVEGARPGPNGELPGNSTDPVLLPAPDTGWTEATFYYAYQPGHTTAVIRCNGREVARVPIRAPR